MAEKRKGETTVIQVPPGLKRAVARRAKAEDSNSNDVAVKILVAQFGGKHQPSGRRAHAGSTGGTMLIRMPAATKRAIERASFKRRVSQTQLIAETLAAALEVPYKPPKRGRPHRRRAA